jgi:hypothetical protein
VQLLGHEAHDADERGTRAVLAAIIVATVDLAAAVRVFRAALR